MFAILARHPDSELQHHARRPLRAGPQARETAGHEDWLPFQVRTGGDRGRRSVGGGDAPDMAAVDIVLI